MKIPFKPIEIEDRDIITSFTIPSNYKNCDYSFVNICSWRFLYDSEFAIVNGSLLIRFWIENKTRVAYMTPTGQGDLKQAIDLLEADSLEQGHPLCMLGVTPDAKEELERLYGVNVLPVQADVSKDGDNEKVVRNVVDRAVETFGGIDVLINNAQASASGITLADHTTEQFDLAVYSGLYATFYYMKACYPYLKKSKGTVINFASGAGLF